MKRFTLIYSFLLAVALPLLIACTIDDVAGEDNPAQKGDNVTVRLRISQAGAAVTRARTHEWDDKYAQDEELMNVWTVVVTDNTGKVKHILACKPKAEDREIDPIETELEFVKGTYHFYSFANISPEYVKYLLGFISSEPTADDTFDDTYKQGDIISFDLANTTWAIAETDAKTKTIGINGNCFNVSSTNNGFLSAGIPMSNIQTMDIDEETGLVDLIVVRMLAKIEFWLYNDYGNDLKIKSITLTDITKNADTDAANLKLFPRYTDGADGVFPGADKKDGYKHGDIHPNLTNPNATENLTIYPTSDGAASLEDTSNTWTISTDKKYEENNGTPNKENAVKISFYVNESEKPKGENWGKGDDGTTQQFNHYFLKITIDKGENQKELRYALIDDNGTKDGEKWDYIARNDYRIIPIVLDDYKLDMIPYDFPAIGVSPASVKEEDGIYTINFHDYGHFHLVPQVTRYSDKAESKTYVPYGKPSETDTDKTYWTLVEDENKDANKTWKNSWSSWTDATKATDYDNATGGFYRNQTAEKDGDEAGGVPVWYENTSNPKWRPNATIDYQPFIFGYIADPEGKLTEDRKVYHEFSIYLYKQGMSPPRQMTYRLYMILDEKQMLYSRGLGASAPRHTHHSH